MREYKCIDCGKILNNRDEIRSHRKKCLKYAFNLGPSFKSGLSPRLMKLRIKVIGSYEWALCQSNKKTPTLLKNRLMLKKIKDLEKEIIRLENCLVFNEQASTKAIKRLIAFSHSHKYAINLSKYHTKENKNLNVEDIKKENNKSRKKARREMNAKLKPDIDPSNDIMDVYYSSGKRAVVSGGLPTLGKRK